MKAINAIIYLAYCFSYVALAEILVDHRLRLVYYMLSTYNVFFHLNKLAQTVNIFLSDVKLIKAFQSFQSLKFRNSQFDKYSK